MLCPSVRKLFFLHLIFILLTLPVLYLGRFSIFLPIFYVFVLFSQGIAQNYKIGFSPFKMLAVGTLSQLPGIISGFFILTASIWTFNLEPFEFTAQIWQTPFYPFYPLLPHIIYHDIPLYFHVTAIISFVLPLIPAIGAGTSCLIKKHTQLFHD